MLATGSPAMAQVRAAIPAEDRAQLEALTASWRGERDPARRAALAEELRASARKLMGQAAETASGFEAAELEKSAIYDDIAADGRLVETQIKPPKNVRDVPLTVLRSFGTLEAPPYGGEAAVIRRITRDAFELWTPRHGWLFDRKGRLLNQARPPRRDGQGREWYGAFLPDGHWVTTDLWERDDTLTLFSRRGKWLREWPSVALLPFTPEETERARLKHPESAEPAKHGGLIGWARADKEGRGWVVSVGSEGGRGCAWVDLRGTIRRLDDLEPWQRCYPQALGPRGMFTYRSVPSDDQSLLLTRSEASHGPGVGYPTYGWQTPVAPADGAPPADAWPRPEFQDVTIADGEEFGFWAGSRQSYIVSRNSALAERLRTWLFDERARFQRWIAAHRVPDTGSGGALNLCSARNIVITLQPDYTVSEQRRFFVGKGGTAVPLELFSDLRLGFFVVGEKTVLARWHP